MAIRLRQSSPRSVIVRLLLAIAVCSASASLEPAIAVQPSCAIRRPPGGFAHLELDAAWTDYTKKAADAAEQVKQALVRELEAAAGNRDLEAEVRRAIDRLERTGRLPLQKGCAVEVGRCRDACKDAWGQLAAAYKRAAAALREQRNIHHAREVDEEFAKLRAGDSPRPMFVAGRFGLDDGVTLGVRQALKSWDDVDPLPIFADRRLPPLVSDGVLVLELHDAHAKGLKRHDLLHSVEGLVLDGEDEYSKMQAALRQGQPAGVVIKRPVRGGWNELRVIVEPVSRARVEVVHRVKRVYPDRSQPPIGIDLTKPADRQRLADMQLDAEVKMPRQNAVVKQIFTDNDGLLSDLTLAVAAGSADDIVAIFEELGADRIRAMDELVRRTEWGMLRSKRDSTLTNGKVLLKAWEAVEKVFFPK